MPKTKLSDWFALASRVSVLKPLARVRMAMVSVVDAVLFPSISNVPPERLNVPVVAVPLSRLLTFPPVLSSNSSPPNTVFVRNAPVPAPL